MKRGLQVAIFLCGLLLAPASAFAFNGGSGAPEDPYVITTCDQLVSINNDIYSSYILFNDLECDTQAFPLTRFVSGGGVYSGFEGVLDGAGHTVTYNLSHIPSGTGSDYLGLFGFIEGGTVKNLTVATYANIGGGDNVGFIAGKTNGATLINVHAAGTINASGYVGGLVGRSISSHIADSSFSGQVNGVGTVGGLIGTASGNPFGTHAIDRSHANGSVTSIVGETGGLVGFGAAITVENSYASESIDAGSGTEVGGIIGGTSGATIVSKSYAVGSVAGFSQAGGIVGAVIANTTSILNSFAATTFGGAATSHNAGGILGYSNTLDLTNNFWDTDISQRFVCSGTFGLNGTDCLGVSPSGDTNYWNNAANNNPLSTWNFSSIWKIDNTGYHYPTLLPVVLTDKIAVTGSIDSKSFAFHTATAHLFIPIIGSANVVAYGVQYADQTTIDNLGDGHWDGSSGKEGNYFMPIEDAISFGTLSCGHTYHYQTYATSADDSTVYGGDHVFVFSCPALAPALTLDTIADNSVDLEWSMPDAQGGTLSSYQLFYKKTSGANFTQYSPDPSDNSTVTISGLDAGTSYDFKVAAVTEEDGIGAFSSVGSFSTTDTEAPTVSVTMPSSNESTTTATTVALAATAGDNVAVAGVTFYVNGLKIGVEATTSPYTLLWDTSATTTGAKSVIAVARDTSNNYATSTAISFTVNRPVSDPPPQNNAPLIVTSSGGGSIYMPVVPVTKPATTTPIVPVNPTSTPTYIFTRNLHAGMTGADVKELQKYLNAHGFVVAKVGTGSVGQESTFYGPATAKAVTAFQEDHAKDILTPSKLTKGTGIFANATRSFVNTNK